MSELELAEKVLTEQVAELKRSNAAMRQEIANLDQRIRMNKLGIEMPRSSIEMHPDQQGYGASSNLLR